MYLSAVLVDLASWRWLFVLPVALVVVAVVMALRSIPNSREESAHRFDAVGSLASVVAVVGLIFVLHEGPERGWTAPVTLLSLLVGVVGAAGFVAWELRQQAPLLDVRLFRERGLASGSVSLLTVFGVQAGIFVVLFPYFQAVLGWSGLRSTLALMPMAVLMMLASGLAPRAAARIGRPLDDGVGDRPGRRGPGPHGHLRLRRRRLPLGPPRHARHGTRHGLDDDPLHRGHHQRPAARTPRRRVRAQRRHQGVRYRARRRAARSGPVRRLPRRHRLPARRNPRTTQPTPPARASPTPSRLPTAPTPTP